MNKRNGVRKVMLINFFFTLREHKVPTTIRELLDLIRALEQGLAYASVDDFYLLSRTVLVKDEKHFDKFDKAFAKYFEGIEFITPELAYAGLQQTMDFGQWTGYVADRPAVLLVRVAPKQVESLWMKIARGAAMTQGVALPPIKHFEPGFARMRAAGREIHYSARPAALSPLSDWTSRMAGFWEGRMDKLETLLTRMDQ